MIKKHMNIQGVSFIMIDKSKPKRIIKLKESIDKSKRKYKRKPKKQIYCKRCGATIKNQHLQIQLTSKRLIAVCSTCFEWARDKTMAEIRKDYRERAKRKIGGIRKY